MFNSHNLQCSLASDGWASASYCCQTHGSWGCPVTRSKIIGRLLKGFLLWSNCTKIREVGTAMETLPEKHVTRQVQYWFCSTLYMTLYGIGGRRWTWLDFIMGLQLIWTSFIIARTSNFPLNSKIDSGSHGRWARIATPFCWQKPIPCSYLDSLGCADPWTWFVWWMLRPKPRTMEKECTSLVFSHLQFSIPLKDCKLHHGWYFLKITVSSHWMHSSTNTKTLKRRCDLCKTCPWSTSEGYLFLSIISSCSVTVSTLLTITKGC